MVSKYRPIAAEAAELKAESFILEREMIVANDAGLSDFHALSSAITRLYFVAFDLLHLNRHDPVATLAILRLQVEIVGDTLPQNAYEFWFMRIWLGSQA